MPGNFAPIGQLQTGHSGDNSFWPSFTDIMMVITMIFLMATSLLVVRNWQLVAELRESVAAERLASQLIQSTSQENATLEERLANAEQSNSILRLRLLKKDEELQLASEALRQQENQIASLEIENADFKLALDQANTSLATVSSELDQVTTQYQQADSQVANLGVQLEQQQLENDKTRTLLATAQEKIRSLEQSSLSQQNNISSLTQEKLSLNQEIEAYRRQLLAVKDEYKTSLSAANAEIESLTQLNLSQQQDIASLTKDRQLQNKEIEAYNRQLLTLKGKIQIRRAD
jgi:chromosome segregation ATPase